MASILPSAYVRHGHSCTDVACWHLLSVFPVSYVGELPLRVVERAHHTLPENTHFTPTLLRLAVHAEIMSTFAFRETFCRLASPQEALLHMHDCFKGGYLGVNSLKCR